MILLFNIKLTDIRMNDYRKSAHYPKDNRFDVFKYSLASFASFLALVSKCYFYIEVAEEFKNRQDELEAYIKELYPENKLILRWYRNDYTRDWRKLCEEFDTINDDLIWVACNDDHMFIDSSLDVLTSGLELLKKDSDPMAILYYSHWPEQMNIARHYGAELQPNGDYVKFTWGTYDSSINIVKKERFKRYWHDFDFGDELIFRPDEIAWKFHKPEIQSACYSPTKEIARHYDGYGHVGYLNHLVSPLRVPYGFFENNIKIKYGFNQRDDRYTNLNPGHSQLYSADPAGTDYRWAIEDIPMCWKDKVTEIKYAEGVDSGLLKQYRNQNIVNSSCIPMVCYGVGFGAQANVDVNWFKKHFI